MPFYNRVSCISREVWWYLMYYLASVPIGFYCHILRLTHQMPVPAALNTKTYIPAESISCLSENSIRFTRTIHFEDSKCFTLCGMKGGFG
jgi:hypothetical protein